MLDIDETLIHSNFHEISDPDEVLNIIYDGNPLTIHVKKRPHLDAFLERMSKCYEVVFFTASLSKYAKPLLERIDKKKIATEHLYRGSCL